MAREVTRHTLSQNDKILKYLQTHKSINQLEACYELSCFRLSARIADLKERGHNIKTTMVTRKNSEGHTVNYAEYSLVKEN